MLCVAGRGGQPEWDMQARKVLDALRHALIDADRETAVASIC